MTGLDDQQAEIERLHKKLDKERSHYGLLHEQLAASQAREHTLREALNRMAKAGSWQDMNDAVYCAREALTLPTDDTALKEYRKQVLLEVITEWEKPYGLTDGTKFIDRLRRMAEEN